jgi:hypothetical protein
VIVSIQNDYGKHGLSTETELVQIHQGLMDGVIPSLKRRFTSYPMREFRKKLH